MTFTELCNRLKNLEETILVEVLDIHSDQIVDRFQDLIENKRSYLEDDLEITDVFDDDELLDTEDQ